MNLLRAAVSVSALTLLSRITGLVREVLIARTFGAASDMDAFSVAFRLPNLLRRLFAEGAFSQAFVPIFAHTQATGGSERARALLSHVASALFWTVLAVSALGVVAAPALVVLVASGFLKTPAVFDLATLLTRWMFPYILCMSLVACAAGALNTFGHFAVPAVTPVLLNVSMIALTVLAAPYVHPPILALAIGVLVGGVLQLAVQLPALARIRMLPPLVGLRSSLVDPQVRRVLRQMGPAVFAVSVAQLSLIINTSIASYLGAGSNAWLYFADRLMEFPTALLGVALGTVLLPSLSRAYADNRPEQYSRLIDWGLRMTCLIALPAMLAMVLLADGMIAALFAGGRFGPHDVTQTGTALVGYAVGLIGLIAIKILAPGFYAQQDIRTPVKIAVVALIGTQIANLALVPWLRHAGLALSVSLGACVNAGMLLAGLRRRGIYHPLPGWTVFLVKLLLALCALAVLLWLIRANLPVPNQGSSFVDRLLWVSVVIGAGSALYASVLWLLGFRLRDFVLRSG
ncbi:MAG TPA: murein biosynthesis integral membrane protein MurJ [Burkholderiaceae bacterium]|nr:murein biosynthesis integral membrane protein MurJ [Burkholderiaceae bacterium]